MATCGGPASIETREEKGVRVCVYVLELQRGMHIGTFQGQNERADGSSAE